MEASDETPTPGRRASALVLGALLLFGVVILRSAWVSDDAFITLRTVDNFVEGYGLRWNVDERVQVNTHPLWMLALAAVHVLAREPYVTAMFLGLATTAVFLFALVRFAAAHTVGLLFGLACLAASKAFVDYSTSGLENPLTHLLLVLGFGVLWGGPMDARRLQRFALVAGLAVVNRMDVLLLFLPALLVGALRVRATAGTRRTLGALFLGFAPFWLWELFALVYYGFLFPNVAYAKLNTGIPAGDYAAQGLRYFAAGGRTDPATLAVILLALGAAWFGARGRPAEDAPVGPRVAAIGILLYLSYVVRIGGDFMLGRFFAAPLVLGCLILVRSPLVTFRRALACGLAVLLVGVWPATSPLRAGPDYGGPGGFHADGITDERAFYYPFTGLLRGDRTYSASSNPWSDAGRRLAVAAAAGEDPEAVVGDAVGAFGFHAGPAVTVVDKFALTDPFLARLPVRDPTRWRIGHFERELPEGYLETRSTGTNRLADPELARRYELLRGIVAGELWDLARWRRILALNLGMGP